MNSLRLEFIYLNTNFDSTDVGQPLEGYFDFSLKSGLEYAKQ